MGLDTVGRLPIGHVRWRGDNQNQAGYGWGRRWCASGRTTWRDVFCSGGGGKSAN